MPNKKKPTPSTPDAAPTPDAAEAQEKTEAPRAKTPLEKVRERQAQMRGQQPAAGRGSSDTESSGPAESYKRRLHQRKSG